MVGPSCPRCGSPDELIGRLALHLEFPLGFSVFFVQSELEWTQQSSMTCNACEHSGELYEFFPQQSASPLLGTGGFLTQAFGDIRVMNGSSKLDEDKKKFLRNLAKLLRGLETTDREVTSELQDIAKRLEVLTGQGQSDESTSKR